MAAFDTTRPVAVPTAGRISNFAARTFNAVAAWNDARVTRNSLSRLSARELDDIGLCVADIDAISRRSIR